MRNFIESLITLRVEGLKRKKKNIFLEINN